MLLPQNDMTLPRADLCAVTPPRVLDPFCVQMALHCVLYIRGSTVLWSRSSTLHQELRGFLQLLLNLQSSLCLSICMSENVRGQHLEVTLSFCTVSGIELRSSGLSAFAHWARPLGQSLKFYLKIHKTLGVMSSCITSCLKKSAG